jgi:hypothetical protein
MQTDRIISDRIWIRIQKFDADIRYLNIRVDTDTDMVLNFNYMYPNSRYIPYSLIYIIEIFIYIFTDIRYPIRIRLISNLYPYPKNKSGYEYDFITIRSISDPFASLVSARS